MTASNTEVWQLATVCEVVDVATGIRRIVVEPDLPLRARPGSHLDVMVTVGETRQRRSYSIVDSTTHGDRLAITVLAAPQSRGGSTFMHSLGVDDRIEVTQPLQNFPLRIGADRYLLLAGGVGITAIAAMAEVLRAQGADYTLIYAGRSRNVMAYLDELQAVHGARLQAHIRDEGTRLVVADLLGEAGSNTELYMCGPIRLMDEVRRQWTERGLSLPNLRYETFGSSGWHDPQEFVVRIPRLGVETVVDKNQTMLEALERAGVEMMFDCRRGECGLCEVRILEIDGEVDHRDVFYSERQRDATARMCCCVSRVARTGDRAVVSIEVT